MTALGLGLAALGRPGYINLGHADDLGPDRGVEAMRSHAHAVLDRAWSAGIRYYDAARSYGRAEEFLAAWLAASGRRPGELTVGSKWGYVYTADWRADADVHEVKDYSLDNLRRQAAESRAILGEFLDLYQIHSATLDSGVLDDRAVLAELAALREEGLEIGLSLSGPRQADTLRRALEVEVFTSVQATWNPLEPSAGPALAEAAAAGWRVIVKEAVANGRLTPRGAVAGREPLRGIAATRGVGVDAVAIAAAMAQPWATIVLSGAATVEQLEGNVAALSISLSATELDALLDLAEPPERYWSARGEMPWT
jgi:aryl-alcohol dehydrogenase-like predicted oxidoreductase